MAFKEQKLWTAMKAASDGILKLQRIETSTGDGIPDVIGENRAGKSFWIELKALEEWPKRDTTCPLKGKFEKGQLGFMRAWMSWNGKAYVLLRVGVEFYLLDPRLELEKISKVEMLATAVIVKGKTEVVNYLKELA